MGVGAVRPPRPMRTGPVCCHRVSRRVCLLPVPPCGAGISAGAFLEPGMLKGWGAAASQASAPPTHPPSPFIFLQWRVFLPSLKFEVIDSSYISLYTGKGHAWHCSEIPGSQIPGENPHP